jgi:hypothetical protein
MLVVSLLYLISWLIPVNQPLNTLQKEEVNVQKKTSLTKVCPYLFSYQPATCNPRFDSSCSLAATSAPSILSRIYSFGCHLVSFPSTSPDHPTSLFQPPSASSSSSASWCSCLCLPHSPLLIVSPGPDYSIYRSAFRPPPPYPFRFKLEL